MPGSMTPYANQSGTSGVRTYRTGADFIEVMFKSRDIYLYTVQSTSRANIEAMKKLAIEGRGLGTFISQKVKGGYARRGKDAK
jgi:hypothetical protein